MEKNTKTLAKYLFTKGINSSLKIQKILFFLYVEEKKSNNNFGFFNDKDNFQAWIYGPVNPESFYEMQKYFSNNEEKENFLLSKNEIKQIDKIYGKWFDKYEFYSSSKLITKSHKNLSWINARGDLDENTPCRTFMIEDETFLTFKK